jgi:formate hydrogenlyase subunit 3/multisubunit Na+/H+ antiporter MnhD subunit
MTPVDLILWATGAFFGLAVLAIAFSRSRAATPLIYGGCLLVCSAICVVALTAALAGGTSRDILPVGLPWIGAHFRLDALSAVFVLVVGVGGAAASLFALGYGRHEREPARVLPFYAAFLGGMNLVVIADDAFSFLVAWELMSLSSWALVCAHHRDPDNRRAAYVYLLMAGFGALCLLLAFGLMAGARGGYAFDAIRARHLTAGVSALVLALTILGAGSKAGLVPLHVWLPLAHPAAPSHVSALMSGVMTKVAIYGFVRIVFDLLGPAEWWWGLVVLSIGGATAVLGVLYALMQDDLKRVLAYSTIENIGFVFVALGLSLAFRANGVAAAAALALTAALFHVINHALFKSLLFFGSGAVLSATGERRMDRLGGLIGPMPRTAFAFLIGAMAISALPPLNGFASEWLMLQAIILGPRMPQWSATLLVPAVGGVLALAAAFAGACFVRAFGMTFLGRPRTAAAAQSRETDGWSLAAMFLLAGLCLAAGLLPGFVIDGLAPAVKGLAGARMPVQADQPWLSIVPIAESRSSYNGLLVFVFVLASAGLAALAIHRFATHAFRRAPAWDCGFPDASPATQYSPASFAQPLRRVFGSVVFQAREQVVMPPPGDLSPARFSLEIHDPIWERLYLPIAGSVGWAADRLNRLQFLTIRRYLGLVFLTLVALLLVLALWL